MPHILHSPLYILIPYKTKPNIKWYLNLNKYRNTHFQILNKTKIAYKEYMAPQLEALPVFTKVALNLHIYARDKRLFDLDNIASVHLKFFQDALVQSGRIPDDSYIYIPEIHIYFEKVDKLNPRVVIIIKEIK